MCFCTLEVTDSRTGNVFAYGTENLQWILSNGSASVLIGNNPATKTEVDEDIDSLVALTDGQFVKVTDVSGVALAINRYYVRHIRSDQAGKAVVFTTTNVAFYLTDDYITIQALFGDCSAAAFPSVDLSITGAGTPGDPFVLVGDEDAPGVDQVYGTDAAGVKGWKDDPAGSADGNGIYDADNEAGTTAVSLVNLGSDLMWDGASTFQSIFQGGIAAFVVDIFQLGPNGGGLRIDGNTGSNMMVVQQAGGGSAVFGNNTGSGIGVTGWGTNEVGVSSRRLTAATNTAEEALAVELFTSEVPTPGIGAWIGMAIPIAAASSAIACRLQTIFTDLSGGAQHAKFSIWVMNSGAIAEKLSIDNAGKVALLDYGVGAQTGTPAGMIEVNSAGELLDGKLITHGTLAGTTDINGDVEIAHGLGTAAFAVSISVNGTTARMTAVHSKDADSFAVRLFDAIGVAVTEGAIDIDWLARAI